LYTLIEILCIFFSTSFIQFHLERRGVNTAQIIARVLSSKVARKEKSKTVWLANNFTFKSLTRVTGAKNTIYQSNQNQNEN
jgi:hypothetical protein